MSMSVVKVEAELVSSSRVEADLLKAISDPSGLALDARLAMPAEFNETWNENENLVLETFLGEISQEQAKHLAEKKKAKSLVAFLGSGKGLLASIASSVGFLVGGTFILVPMFPGFEGPASIATLLITSVIMSPSFMMLGDQEGNRRAYMARSAVELEKVSNQVRGLSSRVYQRVISRWALQRYGVIMTTRWDSQVPRLADDIIFVGEKDGEKVYCQERPEGWVLTYNNGTELPVLVNEKELVSA